MTTKRVAFAAFLMMICLALPTFAQPSKVVTKGPIVIKEFKHDTGPLLREIAPLLPEYSLPSEHEIENNVNPNHNWSNKVQKDPVLQTAGNSPSLQTPNFSLEFDGAGVGDNFFCNCMPPDNDGAPGTTQYVQYINLEYQVFDKKGNTVLGPLAGNSFWSGFGGSCQADNSGDPIVRFDAAAQRWVVSQFAINSFGSDYECVAVSQTADATGAYNRYAFAFSDFPDYPKMSVWPDAYYFTFNNFNLAGSSFVGANVCAADRSKMLTGAAATIQCFQRGNTEFGMLPSDLDGATPPAAGTPNFVMELDPTGAANLYMYKFHVDFVTPTNTTFTGPTIIPVAAFTPLCNTQTRSRCVQQPTTGSDLLESLGDRLMYRLVYRNFGDHTTLLTSHSIVAGSTGGVRWYEIHNPETTPTMFQSGTFAPDSQYRWMPAIAMDANQNIAVGFSRSGTASGQYPSLVYAGRVPSDAAGTLESEVVLKAGLGSQTGGGDRWGDYSSVTVDPTDDCTFWFTEEYEKVSGGFNWSTAIGTFSFPGCAGGTPDFSLTANPSTVTVVQGNSGTSTITVNPLNGFAGSVTMSASGLPSGVTAGFAPNPTATSSTLTLTASATAATGTSTVTITGVSGSLTHTTTVSLTVNSSTSPSFTLTANPSTVSVAQGASGTSAITVVPANGFNGSVTLGASGLPSGVTAGFSPNPTTTTSTLTLTASATAARGTSTVTITGTSGSLTATTSVSLTVTGTGGPAVTVSPTSLTWGTIVQGVTSGPKTVTVTNTGTATVNISSITTSGDFAQTPSSKPCGSTLAVGANCKIKVTFTPTQLGLRTGNLTITDNASNSPQTVPLSGTGGPQATLTPASATYPARAVGTTSPAKVFTLTNKQTAALTGIVISTTGDFSVSSTTCPPSLGGPFTCTINVVFTPTAVGARTGTLSVADSASNSPQTASLKGTGK